MGRDSIPVARDAYGYSLYYYGTDYKPIGSTGYNNTFATTPTTLSTFNALYNGNIAAMSVNIPQLTTPWHYYTYRYDQLNRIKKNHVYTGSAATTVTDYQEDFTYDGNGNILTANRNMATATRMDSLKYNYNTTDGRLINNRLNYITDAVTTHTWPYGLTNQPVNNYTYDATGNMTADVADTISNVNWTVYGKILNLTNSKGTISYTYNPAGERASKTVGTTTTWYIRDAQGNPLALYNNAHSTINWKEQDLYGSSRLGMWTPNVTLTTGNAIATWDTIGNKYYELTNHLGNVLATITDKRIQHGSGTTINYFTADVATAQEYYTFGGLMPGRTFDESFNYRYGFNGKENDNEVKGTGNEQDYGMRIYDPRLGRFLSVDPLSPKYPELTPYQFASNTPIQAVDIDGLEASTTKVNNVFFVKLQNVTMNVVIRQSENSFTQTAIEKDDFRLTDITINTQQYNKEKGNFAAFKYVGLAQLYPQSSADYKAVGYSVSNGKIIAGISSPQTFYFSQATQGGTWTAGQGNTPQDSFIGIGGGIPLYVNGLKYGEKNIYSKDAPKGLPPTGDPGPGGIPFLIQKSNKAYPLQNNTLKGKTVLGYNSNKNVWIVVVQKDGVKGMSLDQIRDNLINKGYTDILSFDGSTSSTLVRDKTVIVSPQTYKDNTITTGATLSVPQKQ